MKLFISILIILCSCTTYGQNISPVGGASNANTINLFNGGVQAKMLMLIPTDTAKARQVWNKFSGPKRDTGAIALVGNIFFYYNGAAWLTPAQGTSFDTTHIYAALADTAAAIRADFPTGSTGLADSMAVIRDSLADIRADIPAAGVTLAQLADSMDVVRDSLQDHWAAINGKLAKADTAAMLAGYVRVQRLLDSLSAIRADIPPAGITQQDLDDTAAAIRADFPTGGGVSTAQLNDSMVVVRDSLADHWAAIMSRVKYSDTATMLSGYVRVLRFLDSIAAVRSDIPDVSGYMEYTDTASMLSPYLRKIDTTGKWLGVGSIDTAGLRTDINTRIKYLDSGSVYYTKYGVDTAKVVLRASIAAKMNFSDTAAMLANYQHKGDSLTYTSIYRDDTGKTRLTGAIAAKIAAIISGWGINTTGTTSVTVTVDTSSFHVATKTDITGLNPATSAYVATTGVLPNSPTYSNGTLGVGATLTAGGTGGLTVDGVSTSLGDRLLVKNQASAFQNGIYIITQVGINGVQPYILTRAPNNNKLSNINSTGPVFIQAGNTYANSLWGMTSTVATVGTDAINYAQSVAIPFVTAGYGMLSTGTTTVTLTVDTVAMATRLRVQKAVDSLNLNMVAIMPQVNTTTSYSTSMTPTSTSGNIASVVYYDPIAQSGNVTINNVTGSWANHQILYFTWKAASGTPTLTWGSMYRASTGTSAIALPTSIPSGKQLEIMFRYNTNGGGTVTMDIEGVTER